jgi:hypothetical protein
MGMIDDKSLSLKTPDLGEGKAQSCANAWHQQLWLSAYICIAMELSRFVDEPTLAAMNRLLPNVEFEPMLEPLHGSKEPCVSVNLRPPTGADYLFKVYFQPELQIHARLVHVENSRYYFWYRPFEDADFKNSTQRLNKAFVDTLEQLVCNETRIIQKRGLLTHSFLCDYKSPTGWKRVYGKRLTNTHVRQAGSVLKCRDDRKNRVVSAQATYTSGSSAVGG